MARIKTTKGYLTFDNHILQFSTKVMNMDVVMDDLRDLSLFLDKTGINRDRHSEPSSVLCVMTRFNRDNRLEGSRPSSDIIL